MANAQQILARKGGGVISVRPETTVVEAAQLMNENHIGSLVVIGDDGLAGIFTERDVLRRIVAAQLDASTTCVGDVMTTPVACAAPNTPYAELCSVIREKRIRHLPVVEGEKVIGMISIGDLNRAENSEQEQTIIYLKRYMSVS